ncbi:TPA: hypothetical protein H1005_04360 [archaeon]|uniref:2TM domain-containing protein n=1 Tax=Candidatus Naiadarchaeum limnaeum TaxID=2756139 RepID=A0A832V1T5_9ARCH|nr:hypothetical protein [Candidatus Naiadarchaeales archaeon SRR2090153.bin1042]HIK00603.1 hypothetical protein [Candidatus Naiadarchaeum limnaeum]
MAKNLSKELESIKARNVKVEADKAWETSKTRRGIIAVATYFIFVWFLWLIKSPNYWLNALIPAGAYIISTLTLPFVKKWWTEKIYRK